MTDDFTARLRLQLREAALREEDRGGLARAATAVRTRPSLAVGSFAAALAVGLVLVLGLWMVASTDTETAAPDAGPRVVANVAVADALGRSTRGRVRLGVAVRDERTASILRVDPRTRRVTARIPVGSEVSLAAATARSGRSRAGPACPAGPLMRIDPSTNRDRSRGSRCAPPAGGPFRGGGFVVVGAAGVGDRRRRACSPSTRRGNRPGPRDRARRQLPGHRRLVRGGELWLTRGDRTITRFDAVTGRRLGRAAVAGARRRLRRSRTPTSSIKVAQRLRRARRPGDGRPLWRRARSGPQVQRRRRRPAAGCYVEGGNGPASARDTLWQLDPRTGRVAGALTVPVFGVVGVVRRRPRRLWLISAAGRAVVVRDGSGAQVDAGGAGGVAASASLPGLKRSSGSSARLIARIIATASGAVLLERNSALP